MDARFRVLAINPGSTSTKLALVTEAGFEAEENAEAGEARGPLLEQLPSRLDATLEFLSRAGDPTLHAVASRGGLIRPVPSGTLVVNQAMLDDARGGFQGEHVSNLGCLIAHEVAGRRGVPAFAVDEMSALARYTGLPQIRRQALSHALNLHAAARKACEAAGTRLADSRWVVAHLGGGFSVVPMDGGRIVDTNNANSGGPFSPTRAGTLPTQPLIKLCLSSTRPQT